MENEIDAVKSKKTLFQRTVLSLVCLFCVVDAPTTTTAQITRQTDTYRRLKAYLDAVPAIDTHDHLAPFDQLEGYVQTDQGSGMNLCGILSSSYYPEINPLTPWKPGEPFDEWWEHAKHNFVNARATTFYRYLRESFRDLYGVSWIASPIRKLAT